MAVPQAHLGEIWAFGILAIAVILFASGRFRYDLVAVGALLAGVLTGIVPAKEAFSGFTSDVVVIIASALVVSAAVTRSGAVEMALRPLLGRLKSARSQVPVLAGVTALLSMATKNVGALAIVMPAALQLARKTGSSPSSLLMPMSFLSLLGGLVTLVGTSTNIIVSQVRQETLGKPFAMFDFTPVGLGLTVLGLILVSVAWPLLPRNRQGQASMAEAVSDAPYATEATVTDEAAKAFPTVADLKLAEAGVKLMAIAAGGDRHEAPLPDAALRAGDVLILEGESEALDRMLAHAPLKAAREGREVEKGEATEEMRSVEAVVQRRSVLVGGSAQRLALKQQYGVNLLAVGRGGARITQRLRDISLRPGDILVLQAGERALPNIMKTLGVLPLAERDVRMGGVRRRIAPVLILAAAMILVAFNLLPIAIAFFGAAVLMVATGAPVDARRLRVPRRPGAGADRGPDADQRGGAAHRRRRPDRPRPGRRPARGLAHAGAGGADGGGHGLLAVPAQCADGAGAGPDRGADRPAPAPQSRPVPDGGGDRGGLRLPHPHRPSVQHPGRRAGRLPLHRLLAPRRAPVGYGAPGRAAADRLGVAADGTVVGASGLPLFPFGWNCGVKNNRRKRP